MIRKDSKKIAPVLLEEWHQFKNGAKDPNILSSKSSFRAWWLCEKCAHEWQAHIYHRSNGTGCPKCKPQSAWNKHLSTIINARGSLGSHHPELVLEWHPTKNENVTPYEVAPTSGKKYWWKCPKGDDHEWEAMVSNRVKGRGCPVCSGKKSVLSNCLATTHPALAKEWHHAKNVGLSPVDVTFGSHKKVWWKCQIGHEWEVGIVSRSSGKSECPTCLKSVIGKRRVASLIKRDGSLVETFPDIAKQWHPEKNGLLKPSEFTSGSGQKAWWRCSKGHEWCVPISARKNHGCPKCTYQTSQLEIRIYCELKAIFSDATWRERVAGQECDIFIPHLKLAFEIDGYPWHKDREDQDKLKNTLLREVGVSIVRLRDERLGMTCGIDVFYKPKESHLQIFVRLLDYIKNEFEFTDSEIKSLVDYLLRNEIVNEELFKKMLNDVWTVPEAESIAILYPDVVLDWDFEKNSHLNPKNFSPGSEVSVYWKCKHQNEHRWKGKINSRIKSKGCPFCLGRRVSVENALSTLHPSLSTQWDHERNGSLMPTDVTAGSSKKVYWKCSCGSSWKASIWSRVQSGNKECLECYNKNNRGKSGIKKAILKNGSFAENSPNLAKEWHPTKNASLLPSMLSCGSNIDVWWKCPNGEDHQWQNSIVSRIRGPTCPFCCGKKVGQENSLKIWYPHLAKEWHPTKNSLSPLEVTKSSGKQAWWQCFKGHEWEARINSRVKGRGCPFCAKKKASIDDNLAALYPEIASEWHTVKNNSKTASTFRSKSNVKVWWQCSLHAEHEWEAVINSRTAGNGCPFCAKKKTSSFYSLAVVNPTLTKEWHPKKNLPLLPSNVTPNSGKKVWWQCPKDHEWEATINNRAKGRGCPLCRSRKNQIKT